MKNAKRVLVVMLIVASMFILQGCSYYEELTTPVTSHEVVIDENNAMAFHANLKADLSQGYKWYTYSTGSIDISDTNYRDGFFNDTYTSEYKYIVRTDGEFEYYLILVKDGNLETARIYPYDMNGNNGNGVEITELSAYNLSADNRLMKKLSEVLVIE